MKNNYKYKRGFSLIEVSVGITVLLLIGFAIVGFQKNIFSLNLFLSEGLDVQYEARKALKMITKEARSLSPSNEGAYAIESASSTSFVFYSDTDGDSLKERIRYFLDGDILKRGVTVPSGVPLDYDLNDETISEVIHYIANGATPIFSYYDADYDGTTAALLQPVNIISIRLVKIDVLIDKDPLTPPGVINLTTQISMRNLKDNL